MSVVIPTGDGSTYFFDLRATLDDVAYTLEFRWNVRLEAWFMSIFDSEGTTPIRTSIRLVANWMLASYNTGRTPPGAFVAYDTSGQGIDPGLADLGDRVQLHYLTAADLGL